MTLSIFDNALFISNVITSMMEYQKNNTITKHSVANAQYLHNIIKTSPHKIDVKAKAVIAVSTNYEENKITFVSGHVILMLDNEIMVDPSYDVSCMPNTTYFETVTDLINAVNDTDTLKQNVDIKQITFEHIETMKISKLINDGKFAVVEKEQNHYKKQSEHIHRQHMT